jgi:hypothetical protein
MRRPALPLVLGALLLAVVTAAPTSAIPTGWTAPSRAHVTHKVVAHDLAVEADGTVHLAIESDDGSGVWYVTGGPGAWFKEQITVGDDRRPSIALDGSGVIIAYARMTAGQEGIYTVTNVTGEWVTERRFAGAASDPSVAAHDGRAHLAFRVGSALRYAAGPDDSAAGWIDELVDGTCCSTPPSLALTSGGDARIAHGDGTPASPGGLVLQSRTGAGRWARQSVDAHRVTAPALSVFGTGLHIAYVRRGAGTWYAAKPGTPRWTLKQLDAAASAPPDISAFSGSAALIFGKTGKLRYATMSGGILLTRAFSSTKGDRLPRVTRAGGKPVITWLRSNGGSGDGILVSRQK